MATIADRLEEAYPGENANLTMRMASLIDETVGDVRTALVLLACAVGYYRLIEGGSGPEAHPPLDVLVCNSGQ
jgi:hypothetical protein